MTVACNNLANEKKTSNSSHFQGLLSVEGMNIMLVGVRARRSVPLLGSPVALSTCGATVHTTAHLDTQEIAFVTCIPINQCGK